MLIDSRSGGLGDVWMRLAALYSLTALRPGGRHGLIVNAALVPLARTVFGSRLDVAAEGKGDVIYTHLGLRHLAGALLRGRQYVFPFHWLLRERRKVVSARERLNDWAIAGAALTGRVVLPDPGLTDRYQGYMEFQALAQFRTVTPAEFEKQARIDFEALGTSLRAAAPGAAPGTGSEATVVFPSGSAHQVMPPDWAALRWPGALFAFHSADRYADSFASLGLRIARFRTPEEMLTLGSRAARIVATDSFPSHVWQVYRRGVVILLTQQPAQRIVHPGFPPGQTVPSRAPCSPCRNRDREHHKLCDAGHSTCVTWNDSDYINGCERICA